MNILPALLPVFMSYLNRLSQPQSNIDEGSETSDGAERWRLQQDEKRSLFILGSCGVFGSIFAILAANSIIDEICK